MIRPRVAVVADLREERWPSMDLVADVLVSGLESETDRAVDPFHLCPPMVRRLTRVPWLGQRALLNTTDRVINRYWDYPRWLRGQIDRFDLFHIVDHSYAHLATHVARRTLDCDLPRYRCLRRRAARRCTSLGRGSGDGPPPAGRPACGGAGGVRQPCDA